MNETNHTIHEAVKAIKTAILQSQLKVAREGNKEQLALYYGIGHYVSDHSRKGYWGTSAIDAISEQLQKELPGLRGFGVSNIKNMRVFYEQWSAPFISPAVAGETGERTSAATSNGSECVECQLPIIRQPWLPNLNFDEFVSVSFTHHMEILSKTKTVEERLFYIHQTNLAKWDKYKLREMLKADLSPTLSLILMEWFVVS